MKKLSEKIKKQIVFLLNQYPLVKKIVQTINQERGRALLVGGAVRDLLLDLQTKDLDIEIYGLTPEQLEKLLGQFGPVSLVGKVFGVFRVHGLDVDWSLPRADSPGRKPEVKIDPFMSFEDAFRRRDLTVNAMGIDIMTFELIDLFNGLQDVKNKILRTPDARFFIQDPLRFYRVMQFIGRFEMMPNKELNDICKSMDISEVSRERIEKECKKLFLKSKRPSLGIRWIYEIGRLHEVLPELYQTVGIKQDPKWHPEGEVFEHTMQTVDAAALIAQKYEDEFDKLVLSYAALCHDLGKVSTTEEMEEGIITSLGHAKESEQLAKHMLKRITHHKELVETVAKLVRYHMHPVQLVFGHAKLSAYKRLANKLAPHTTLQMLADLSLADKRGRNPKGFELLQISDPDIDTFLVHAHKAKVLEEIEKPILLGRDLLDVIEPGPQMGDLLKKAYQIQIEEGIKNKKELKRRIIKKTIE